MPKKTPQPAAAESSAAAEQPLPFADHCEVLRKGVALSLGNYRRASILIDNAERLERQASQYRMHIAAIKAAGGPRSGVRLGPLTKTLTRIEQERNLALADAEMCLNQPPNDVLPDHELLG